MIYHLCYFCLVLLCFHAGMFVYALWSPVGKGLTSWLSFVMSNCNVVTFPLVSWVRCGAWLYQFQIFALRIITFSEVYRNWSQQLFCYMTFQLRVKISTFSLVVGAMFNLLPKDFLTSFINCYLKYINVVFCISKCILILWMWYVKFNHKTFFLHFVYSNKDKWTYKTKQLLKFMKVYSLPVGMWNSKSCQFHAAHASFILEKCQKY